MSPVTLDGCGGRAREFGVTVNHANGTRGTLDARRDFQVSVSQATATLNKATMQVAGERDRSIATAAWNLAQSRNTYETSWAALDLDSSGWSLGDSSLVMMGFVGSSTATTTTTSNTTTVTTTGSGTGSGNATTSNTSTGVSPSVSSGASYFTRLFTETGATQDGSINPPSSGLQISVTPTNPQTNPPTNPQPDPPTPAPPTVPFAAEQNDAPGYEPPATRSTPLNIWTGLLPVEDPEDTAVLPPKNDASAMESFWSWLAGTSAGMPNNEPVFGQHQLTQSEIDALNARHAELEVLIKNLQDNISKLQAEFMYRRILQRLTGMSSANMESVGNIQHTILVLGGMLGTSSVLGTADVDGSAFIIREFGQYGGLLVPFAPLGTKDLRGNPYFDQFFDPTYRAHAGSLGKLQTEYRLLTRYMFPTSGTEVELENTATAFLSALFFREARLRWISQWSDEITTDEEKALVAMHQSGEGVAGTAFSTVGIRAKIVARRILHAIASVLVAPDYVAEGIVRHAGESGDIGDLAGEENRLLGSMLFMAHFFGIDRLNDWKDGRTLFGERLSDKEAWAALQEGSIAYVFLAGDALSFGASDTLVARVFRSPTSGQTTLILEIVPDAAKGASRDFPIIAPKDLRIRVDSPLFKYLETMELTEEARRALELIRTRQVPVILKKGLKDLGIYQPELQQIWIRADLDIHSMVQVLVHEARHEMQHRLLAAFKGLLDDSDYSRLIREADAWGATARFLEKNEIIGGIMDRFSFGDPVMWIIKAYDMTTDFTPAQRLIARKWFLEWLSRELD